jgi:mycofactocin biosynthetic radical S-adenosylmethionine protein MftC
VSIAQASPGRLADLFQYGLDAPICLTWELTYACNLSCVHCLSSSGRRDPGELTTAECKQVIDTLERMQVFYVNIGGGEPTVRPDFWELVDYATAMRAIENLAAAGFRGFKLPVVMTRQNIGQLDEFKAIADRFGAQLRITRLRPSGRGADVWSA